MLSCRIEARRFGPSIAKKPGGVPKMYCALNRKAAFLAFCLTTLALSVLGSSAAHASLGVCNTAGPIEIEASGGDPGPTAYATLTAAFAAVNAGTHTGTINVEVCGN